MEVRDLLDDEPVTFAGCFVERTTFATWQRHWIPRAQPFFVDDSLVQRLPAWPLFTRQEFQKAGVSLSLHDTFATYNVIKSPPWVIWLTYEAFYSLNYTERLDLLIKQRNVGRGGVFHLDEVAKQFDPIKLATLTTNGYFVWWPQLWERLLKVEQKRVLRTFIETDRLFCKRAELTPSQWHHISTLLPDAQRLAGSFLPESGGNCLATVMAAFGAPAIAEQWVHPEPFERWLECFSLLSQVSARSLDHAALGHVLVWRDENARVQHAAVGLGAGFLLHKEAQSWYAPRQVVGLEDAIDRWQDSGQLSLYGRLEEKA